MSYRFVYMTAGSPEEARRLGKALVEERLVACVNILQGMTSMFWWEGGAQTEQEVVLIAKTKGMLINDLIARVKELHSYECPCVVAFPISEGNPDFLEWINDETKG